MNFSRFFSKASLVLLALTALLTFSTVIAAQNSLNNPQLIDRRQTLIQFNGDNKEQFLAFTGRGSVSVTFDVKANSDNAGVYVDFLSKNGKSLSPTEVVQAQNSGTDRTVKTISLNNKTFQTVILKLKSIAYGSRGSYPGELKITLSGDVKGLQENKIDKEDMPSGSSDIESVTELDSAGRSIDNPKLLSTKYTLLNFRGNDEEQFLSFTGQGDVEIIYDVKAKGTNAGAYIILLDENGDELTRQEEVQAINKGTKRLTQRVQLNERKIVIIKIVSIKYGSNLSYPGTLKITLNKGFVKDSE